jgi:membrane-associated phospholipid phosphatase
MLHLSAARQSEVWSFIRTTPATFLMTLMLMSVMHPSVDNYLFTLFYILCFIANGGFKLGFKALYWLLNTDYIPLIGQGSRPAGAHSCSAFITVPLIPASTYGMPSGHSQLAWFFATYGCLHIINHEFTYFQGIYTNWNKYLQGLSCASLLVFATTVSYSRVAIEECHTTGQVVWGGILGTVFGCLSYIAKKWIKRKFGLYP